MANVPTSSDWAWPALIESLQRDISHLRQLTDEVRREAAAARDRHRQELDGLIDQLRLVRNELDPILKERDAGKRLAQETRWRWFERLGWVAMGGVALAVWELIKRNLR